MGNMSEMFMKSIWIPFICHLDVIQEELHNMCVLIATNWLMIFVVSYFIIPIIGRWPNLQKRQVFLNTPFAHIFLIDLFGIHQRVMMCPSVGVIPRSAHLK
jgi:hypothetical protein